MKTQPRFAQRLRRAFFLVHLWLGLGLGLWFALVGITGSVLAWRGEASALELRMRFPLSQASGTPIGLTAAQKAVREAHPDLSRRELATATVPNRRMPFYAWNKGRDRATQQTILVDPYSGKVHPPVRMRTLAVGTIQQWHQRLLAGPRGYLANGVLTLLAVPLVLSGLWLWWPTKVRLLKARLTVQRGLSLQRTLYDLHNVMGIYLYPLLFITTLTGVFLVAHHIQENGIKAYLSGNLPSRPAGGGERRGEQGPTVEPQGEKLSPDELVALAQKAKPGYELTRVRQAGGPDEPWQVSYVRPSGWTRNENALLNPYTGQLLPPSAAPERDLFEQASRELHFGEFGGIPTKMLYTFTGLMPLGLFITGTWLWAKKKWGNKRGASERTSDDNISTARVKDAEVV